MTRTVRIWSLLVCMVAFAQSAAGQSTAFTYQGELRNGGQLANGLYDMRFRLYDALTGGSQPGPTQCIDNVTVTGGRFTAVVDLGVQFISTAGRYLEIEVRADAGQTCATTIGFTVLAPRQLITPAPRATAATTANSLAIPNGSSVLVNLTNTGNVGIGTTAPQSLLHVDSLANANTDVIIGSGLTTPAYSALSFFDRGVNKWGVGKNNTNEFYIAESNVGVRMVVAPGGNVGIGASANATNKLFVNGSIGLAPAIRWKSIHGSAFTPQYFDSASFGTVGGLQITDSFGSANSGTVGDTGSSGPAYYFAPVDLPDGALVQDVCLDARDTHGSQRISLSFGKINLGTGFVTEVATTFTSGSGNSIVHPCNGAVSETIDNANNVYFLRARMASTGSSVHWLIAARLKYSVTSPLP